MTNGKGSNRRPTAIPCSDWDAAWERTFGKRNPSRDTYDPRNRQFDQTSEGTRVLTPDGWKDVPRETSSDD